MSRILENRRKPSSKYLVELIRQQRQPKEFLGAARTVKRFPLVIASRYNVPYLLDKEEEGHCVEGEVYRYACTVQQTPPRTADFTFEAARPDLFNTVGVYSRLIFST